jgi:hypothetical protein
MQNRSRTILGLVAFTLSPLPLLADHWRPYVDPSIVQGVDELLYVYSSYCQAGSAEACNMMGHVQQQAGMMFNAQFDCATQNNPQACAFAEQSFYGLQQVYMQTMQAANLQGGGGQQFYDQLANQTGGYVDPNTHAMNMQQIQDWGQSRLDWGAQQSAIADTNHQQFIDYIQQ